MSADIVRHFQRRIVYLFLSKRPAQILEKVDVPHFPVKDITLKSSAEFRTIENKLLNMLYNKSGKN